MKKRLILGVLAVGFIAGSLAVGCKGMKKEEVPPAPAMVPPPAQEVPAPEGTPPNQPQ